MRWLLFDSQKVSGYSGPLRFLRHLKKTGETDVTEFLHGRFLAALDVMNHQLDGSDWLAADRCTIADLACFGYFNWPAEIGVDFAEYPNVAAWVERVKALPGWQPPEALMERAFEG